MIYIQLLESMSLIGLAAYIYNQSPSKKIFRNTKNKFLHKLGLIVFFSILSIIGTYTGVDVIPYAIANTRPIGAITAGYIGGPLVGITVGAIAGSHRYFIGGFTAVACAISTILEGLIGGLGGKFSKNKELNIKTGFFIGIIAEITQMLVILIVAKPFNNAFELEKVIALPMIIINTIGVVIFINITNNSEEQYNRISAIQAQKALTIAKQTLGYMRKGFNKDTAKKISKIIFQSNNFRGVFIADNKGLLDYCGKPLDISVLKNSLKNYYYSPDYKVIEVNDSIGDKLKLFLCIPIFIDGNTLEGVIGLKIKSQKYVDKYFLEFAKELSGLLSTQIELYKLNESVHEACIAEYKALRAQIHPHFLFNALNTISSFCRTNPLKARELILNLSNYFRQTLNRDDDFICIEDELDFIESYLSIEKARFGDRLKVNIDIPKDMLKLKIPVFVLQPIIENSIKHGILPRPSGGEVFISSFCVNNEIVFSIEDTGVGMTKEKCEEVKTNWPGIGLKNVNERLKLLYGNDHQLNIWSSVDTGTRVTFSIPKEVSTINE